MFTMNSPQAQAKTNLELGISGATTTTQETSTTIGSARRYGLPWGDQSKFHLFCDRPPAKAIDESRTLRRSERNTTTPPGDIPLSFIMNDESTLISPSRLVLRLDCDCNVRNRPAKPKPNSATARKRGTGSGGGGMPIHSCRCQTTVILSLLVEEDRALLDIAYHARSAPEEYIPPHKHEGCVRSAFSSCHAR